MLPKEFVGGVLKLCEEKRGKQRKLQYLGNQITLEYELPLAEVVLDFFDRLKSCSRGYASLDYHFDRYEASSVVLNGEVLWIVGGKDQEFNVETFG